MTTEQAREVLRNAGYFVDNLWHIDDVRCKFKNLTDEDCQDLLYQTLTNGWIMDHIWETMCMIGTDNNNYTMIND